MYPNGLEEELEEKEYIVFTHNGWGDCWNRNEMSKKELEQYIDRKRNKCN